jgi:hypothetical protein
VATDDQLRAVKAPNITNSKIAARTPFTCRRAFVMISPSPLSGSSILSDLWALDRPTELAEVRLHFCE